MTSQFFLPMAEAAVPGTSGGRETGEKVARIAFFTKWLSISTWRFELAPVFSSQPAVTNEGGYLTITLTKYPGVSYEVQTAATPDAPAFSAASTTVLVDNTTTLKVRDNILIGTPPARYVRVKVTATP